MLFVFIILVLNFGISWFNAVQTGRCWVDSKAAGGFPRVLAWSGAIMSACGFTYVYMVVIALIAGATGYLPMKFVRFSLELGYVVIIFPVLGSGLMIWVHSVMVAWRERSFGNTLVAGWNTFAQAYNMYEAATTLPGIFKEIGSIFKEADDDDTTARLVLVAILIVVAALVGGVLTTSMIIRSKARESAREVSSQYGFADAKRAYR